MRDSWIQKALGDSVIVDPEQLPSSTPTDFLFYYIDISSVSPGKINFPTNQIEFKNSPSRARKKIIYGDILMSTVRPNLQSFAIFKEKKKRYVASTGFAVLRAKPETNSDFIYHSLFSYNLEKQIENLVVGSNYPAINSSDVKKLKIFIPPITIQNRIAKILNTVDAVIEKTEAAIAKYRVVKQGMMQDLFTRGIDPKTGKLRPTQKDAPQLYKETELGWIPKEWEELRFADRTKVNQGLQIPIESRYKEDGENRFVYITIQYLNNLNSESYKYFIANPPSSVICNEEDILMVRTGNTGMVVTDICGAFHNNFFNIKYSSDLQKDFLVYYLLRSEIQQLILNYAGTTTIPDLKHRDFYRLPLLKPKLAEQDEIANRLIKIDKLIEKEQINLSKNLSLKKGLMQDLLTGKVEVEVKKND